MKKALAFLLSAVMLTSVISLSSCSEEKAHKKKEKKVEVVQKAIPDGNFTAAGSFDGKYPITMQFTVKDHKLAGKYWYNKYGPGNALSIVGRVDTTFVVIQEFDPYGINSGDFKGHTTDVNEITGVFNTHANGKQLPFTIKFEEVDNGQDFFNSVYYVNSFDFGPELETFMVKASKAKNLEPGFYVVNGKKSAKAALMEDDEDDEEAVAEEDYEYEPVKVKKHKKSHKNAEVDSEDDAEVTEDIDAEDYEPVNVPLWVWIVMIVLFVFGFLGCFINKIPGPLLAFIAILMFHFIAIKLPIWALIVAAIVVAGSMVVNYKVLPILAKKVHEYGKAGTWGTTIGSLIAVLPFLFADKWWIGLIIFLIFPFALAYLFELISRKDFKEAFGRAVGAFIVFLASSMLKFAVVIFCVYLVTNAKGHQIKSDLEDMEQKAIEMQEEAEQSEGIIGSPFGSTSPSIINDNNDDEDDDY